MDISLEVLRHIDAIIISGLCNLSSSINVLVEN